MHEDVSIKYIFDMINIINIGASHAYIGYSLCILAQRPRALVNINYTYHILLCMVIYFYINT